MDRVTPLQIRPATPDEYAAAGALCVAAYRADGQLPPYVEGQPDDEYALALADVAARVDTTDVLVAVVDGRVAGCVTLVRPDSPWRETSEDGEAEFRMLAVAPDAQSSGIGSALVRACLDWAIERGYRGVAICARDSNDRARRMYERFGFRYDPGRNWSPRPGIDLLAMRLDLTAAQEVTLR